MGSLMGKLGCGQRLRRLPGPSRQLRDRYRGGQMLSPQGSSPGRGRVAAGPARPCPAPRCGGACAVPAGGRGGAAGSRAGPSGAERSGAERPGGGGGGAV